MEMPSDNGAVTINGEVSQITPLDALNRELESAFAKKLEEYKRAPTLKKTEIRLQHIQIARHQTAFNQFEVILRRTCIEALGLVEEIVWLKKEQVDCHSAVNDLRQFLMNALPETASQSNGAPAAGGGVDDVDVNNTQLEAPSTSTSTDEPMIDPKRDIVNAAAADDQNQPITITIIKGGVSGDNRHDHYKVTTYICNEIGCGRRFMSLPQALHHKGSHHSVGRMSHRHRLERISHRNGLEREIYGCKYPGCGKTFSRRANRAKHEMEHRHERRFVCNIPRCRCRGIDCTVHHKNSHLAQHSYERL